MTTDNNFMDFVELIRPLYPPDATIEQILIERAKRRAEDKLYGFELGINTGLLGRNTQITDVGQILEAFSKTKSLNNLLGRTTAKPSDYRGTQFGEKKFYQPITPDEVTDKIPDKFVPPPILDLNNTFFRGI